jgi:hypothetical protein
MTRVFSLLFAVSVFASAGINASATCYGRAEDIRIFSIVVTELKLRDAQRHIFSVHFVDRGELSGDSTFNDKYRPNEEYRPNRTHRVTTGLDPVVHGDIRLLRPCGKAPLIIWSAPAAVKNRMCPGDRLGPIGAALFWYSG